MSKEEEWLSQIGNSLRNKGGTPVDISLLANPAQGGVPRPSGVAKSIKLHDLISTHPQCGLLVSKVATKRGSSLLVTLVSPPPTPGPPQAPSTPRMITTATAQPAAKIQSTFMSKEEEWLSQIGNSLKNKGGTPVDISLLSNPAQGGVPRPSGVAKSIKLHDLISTHPQCGLLVSKVGRSILVTLVSPITISSLGSPPTQ
jgi:hypothetical protein